MLSGHSCIAVTSNLRLLLLTLLICMPDQFQFRQIQAYASQNADGMCTSQGVINRGLTVILMVLLRKLRDTISITKIRCRGSKCRIWIKIANFTLAALLASSCLSFVGSALRTLSSASIIRDLKIHGILSVFLGKRKAFRAGFILLWAEWMKQRLLLWEVKITTCRT